MQGLNAAAAIIVVLALACAGCTNPAGKSTAPTYLASADRSISNATQTNRNPGVEPSSVGFGEPWVLNDCTVQLAAFPDGMSGRPPGGYPPGWQGHASHSYSFIAASCGASAWGALEGRVDIVLELLGSGLPPGECVREAVTPYLLHAAWLDDATLAGRLRSAGMPVGDLGVELREDLAGAEWAWGGTHLRLPGSLAPIGTGDYSIAAYWWNETAVSRLDIGIGFSHGHNYDPPVLVGEVGPEMLYPRSPAVLIGTALGSGAEMRGDFTLGDALTCVDDAE